MVHVHQRTRELLPLCELKINKKTNELEIENYQNPWTLVDVIDWNEKNKK